MAEITVRTARPDECEALTGLVLRSKAANGYDAAFMEACREELTVRPDRIDEGFLVAEIEGRLAGCAHLTGAGRIETFFVDPDFQRRGVGYRLWESLSNHARHLSLRKLRLDSDPAAEGFYGRLGFVTTGRVPSGSIPGRTLPHMEIEL